MEYNPENKLQELREAVTNPRYKISVRGYTANQLNEILDVPLDDIKSELKNMQKDGRVETHKIDSETVYTLTLTGIISKLFRGITIEDYTLEEIANGIDSPWNDNRRFPPRLPDDVFPCNWKHDKFDKEIGIIIKQAYLDRKKKKGN